MECSLGMLILLRNFWFEGYFQTLKMEKNPDATEIQHHENYP